MATNLIRTSRWGAASPSTEVECRQLLVRAAATCFDAKGPIRATVDDIARVASVHRTTVYNYFPNRDAIIAAVLLSEADDLITDAAGFYRSPGPFADRFTAAFRHIVEGVHQSRVLRRLFDPDAVDLVVRATSTSQEFRDRVAISLTEPVAAAAARGELRAELGVGEVVDWLGSVALMLLGESFRTETLDVVESVRRYVLPGVCRGLESPTAIARPQRASSRSGQRKRQRSA
jgi:AcrR family transcriptional regulator